MTTTTGTDHSPFITDEAKEDTLTGQSHTSDLTMAEVPATIEGIHPTPHPITTAAHDAHPSTGTLSDTLTGTQHTGTATTHPQNNTLLTGVTLTTTLQTRPG